ncbi:hypothetical protein ACHAQJ_001760 [Trichoderma viride]
MTLLRQFIVFATDNGVLHLFPRQLSVENPHIEQNKFVAQFQSNADARQAGIERSLRLMQALVSLFATYRISQVAVLLSLTSTKLPPPTSFLHLRAKINVTRRLLRFFRFLEHFKLGWDLYCSTILDFETWLDVLGRTCLGIFGMLESVTLLDLLEVDQLEIFGAEQTANLNYQAQLFWLIALCTSLIRSSMRLLRCLDKQAAPNASPNHDPGEKDVRKESEYLNGDRPSAKSGNGSAPEANQWTGPERQVEPKSGATEPKKFVSSLILKIVADAMDLLLPATAVGLVDIHPAVIAMAMIISTAITANDVWVRCGKEMRCR